MKIRDDKWKKSIVKMVSESRAKIRDAATH